jgi:ferritin-like metal-binding protein YciE
VSERLAWSRRHPAALVRSSCNDCQTRVPEWRTQEQGDQMKLNSLEDVFRDHLMDLHSAEQQLTQALPKLAGRASSKELKEAFDKHVQATQEHVNRLSRISNEMGIDLAGKTCKAMQGLIKEGEDILQEGGADDAMDAALIAAAQRVEHYEIAAYGSACTYAEELGHDEALRLLKQTLDEEERTDKQLTKIAEGGINQRAMRA